MEQINDVVTQAVSRRKLKSFNLLAVHFEFMVAFDMFSAFASGRMALCFVRALTVRYPSIGIDFKAINV